MSESKFDTESKFGDESKCESKFDDCKVNDELISKVIKYCFGPDFIGVFEKYISDNASLFYDQVDLDEEEHRLEYTELFNDYLALYEHTMENWLEEHDFTLDEFNNCLVDIQESGTNQQKYFVKLLISSGEYGCFYEVMLREAQKQRNGTPLYEN